MRAVMMSLSMLTLAIASSGAFAGHDDQPEYDTARVVSVDPVIEYVDEPVTRDVCRNEPVERYEPRYGSGYDDRRHRDNSGATLLGALVGGALGNTVGHGDGRRAATIAGALIGGAIANDGARRPRYRDEGGRYHRSHEQRCETRTEYRQEERVVGYDVAYEYNGRVYHTQTDAHPGDSIEVEVQVAAVR